MGLRWVSGLGGECGRQAEAPEPKSTLIYLFPFFLKAEQTHFRWSNHHEIHICCTLGCLKHAGIGLESVGCSQREKIGPVCKRFPSSHTKTVGARGSQPSIY